MKTSKTFPPNYEEICQNFDVRNNKNVVFTFGDTLYHPYISKGNLHKDLFIHEQTHVKQQGNDPIGWWKKYFEDVQFRINQETEAYKKQYQFYSATNHNIAQREAFLIQIATILSGKSYGNVISLEEAINLIKCK